MDSDSVTFKPDQSGRMYYNLRNFNEETMRICGTPWENDYQEEVDGIWQTTAYENAGQFVLKMVRLRPGKTYYVVTAEFRKYEIGLDYDVYLIGSVGRDDEKMEKFVKVRRSTEHEIRHTSIIDTDIHEIETWKAVMVVSQHPSYNSNIRIIIRFRIDNVVAEIHPGMIRTFTIEEF
jgi:hypothetical protein